MRAYVTVVYLFLYAPIALIVLFSFNAGRHAADFQGFSLDWYGKALTNPFVLEALRTSLIVALSSAVLATLFGTMAALGLQRVTAAGRDHIRRADLRGADDPGHRHRHRDAVALVTVFDVLNPAAGGPVAGGPGPAAAAGAGAGLADCRAHPVHHGPGRADRPRSAGRHGPFAGRGLDGSLCRARGPPSDRSPCRSCCRRSSPACCWPSPSASTTS